MNKPRYPSLYQINTRVWLTGLSQTIGRPATLDDRPTAMEAVNASVRFSCKSDSLSINATNTPTLASNSAITIHVLMNGAWPAPPRSTQPIAANA